MDSDIWNTKSHLLPNISSIKFWVLFTIYCKLENKKGNSRWLLPENRKVFTLRNWKAPAY